MLTKTLKFDDDVLEVLSAMDWQDGGRLGVITGGQLERGLYMRVNKALENMGVFQIQIQIQIHIQMQMQMQMQPRVLVLDQLLTYSRPALDLIQTNYLP